MGSSDRVLPFIGTNPTEEAMASGVLLGQNPDRPIQVVSAIAVWAKGIRPIQ